MLIAILKGISAILADGLQDGLPTVGTGEIKFIPGSADVPRAYVKNAKAMLDSLIAEYEKKPDKHPLTEIPIAGPPPESGLDREAEAARNDLLGD